MSNLDSIANNITDVFMGETSTPSYNRALVLYKLASCFDPLALDLEFSALVETHGANGLDICRSRIAAVVSDCARASSITFIKSDHLLQASQASKAARLCQEIASHVVAVEAAAASRRIAEVEEMQYVIDEARRVLNIAKFAWCAALTGIDIERHLGDDDKPNSELMLAGIESAFGKIRAAAAE